MSRDLNTIKQRWRAAQAVSMWRRLSNYTRQQLLVELEEKQREATGDGRSEDAAALAAAVNLLDVMVADGALSMWNEASDDVEWLISQVERIRP